MLKCKEIARILSSGEELSWMRQIELKMHLGMCKHCSRYAEQLKMLARATKKLFVSHSQGQIDQLENKIIQAHATLKKRD